MDTSDDGPEFIWQAGDAWRELTKEVRSMPVTVVTWNGTSRLIDLAAGWQQRIPLAGGNALSLDRDRQALTAVEFASPCGVRTSNLLRWHVTSRVVAVLDGHHPMWAASDAGQALLTDSGANPQAPGHPAAVCPVHLCVRR